jgi:hypothetical protein
VSAAIVLLTAVLVVALLRHVPADPSSGGADAADGPGSAVAGDDREVRLS